MQEESGRQQSSHEIPEIDDRIEAVQLAGVVKTKKNKRSQAENIKVARLLRTAAAEIHEQPDNQVGEADQVLVNHRPIHRHFAHDHVADRHPNAAPLYHIIRVAPDAEPHQYLGNVNGPVNFDSVDLEQAVARMDESLCSRTAGLHI